MYLAYSAVAFSCITFLDNLCSFPTCTNTVHLDFILFSVARFSLQFSRNFMFSFIFLNSSDILPLLLFKHFILYCLPLKSISTSATLQQPGYEYLRQNTFVTVCTRKVAAWCRLSNFLLFVLYCTTVYVRLLGS